MSRAQLTGVAILIILAGVVLYTVNVFSKNGNGISCTEDALMCPDGSTALRTAPDCEFSACPDIPYAEGLLREDANGFTLILPAPETATHEVGYVLPVEIRAEAPLHELKGKRARLYGSFTTGNIYEVDRVESLTGDLADPELGVVGVGKSVYVNGVRITLHGVIADYRCPIGGECMEGGAITARVTLKSDTDEETKNMASDEAPMPFDSFHISIVRIAPPLEIGKRIPPDAYVLTFRVTRN